MARAGRLIYEGFFIAWDGFWILWLSNLFWLALMIPVVTAPLAFAGLYACVHGIAHGESLEWNSFFVGIKKYYAASLLWAGANILVFAILGFYTWFFSYRESDLSATMQGLGGFVIVLALLWWWMNMFTFPFMLAQEKPSYWNALRNSAVLFLKWPGQTLGFVLFNGIIIALSLWLRFPWLVFGASLPALMACLCVKDIVEQAAAPAPSQL